MNTQVLPVNEESIALAAKLLQQGELVALPTETVYGIAADARNGEAVKKIFEAKGRPQDNPLIVHICGMEMLHGIVSEVPERAKKLAAAFWPGPLTMVMPRGPEVSEVTCAGLDTVGVRMPSHPVVQAVIKASGVAFAAPSANLSGKPSPTNAQDTFVDMDGRLPLILDGGESAVGVESTVVAVTGEHPMILRPGYVTKEQMEAVLGEEVLVNHAILEKLKDGEVARSPGMKYKHYAPKADVTILKGSFDAYRDYIAAHAGDGVWALCFDGEEAQLPVPAISYGKEGDGISEAHNLFTVLRELDRKGAKTVYARCPLSDGVSMAVYNRLIRAAGFRCVDADQVAREVLLPGSPCIVQLQQEFGADIVDEAGQVRRRLLADRAFATPQGTARLTAITQPEIYHRLDLAMAEARQAGEKLFFVDGAVIVGTPFQKRCSHLVLVAAPYETSVQRICARDGIAPEMARRRLDAQLPENVLRAAADFVIENDGTLQQMQQRCNALLTALRKEAYGETSDEK